MKRLLIFIFFFEIILGLNFVSAQTVSKTLYPTDDTYTYSDNTIRGMEPLLKTYHSTAGSQYRRISFLKFDLSALSPFVQSVKLRLYSNGFAAGGDNAHQFDLYPVILNTWAEDDVTFLNYAEKLGADITSPVLASYIVPAGQALPAQYIEFSGANLLKYVSDSLIAGKRYVSFRLREKNVVKNGTSAVIVEFHSKENSSGFTPELVIEEKDVEQLKASDIKVNNVSVSGFSENKYRYTVTQPWNATIVPEVSATAKYSGSTVSVMQAVSLTGTEANRTAKVNIQQGTDILTYSVVFELLPPPTDARLSEITVDGKPLEFFDKNKENYTFYLPYTQNTVPNVTALTYDPNASVLVEAATSILNTETELSRTTTLNVTSANGTETKTYRVIFHKLPELDMVLAIGQSNMAGRGSYADVTAPMNNVFLLTPAGEMEISSNPMNKYSNIRKDLSLQALGPSYTCALALQNHLQKPVGFVVNAQGGSSITVWYGPGKSNYDATIIRAKEAQRFGRIRAVIWHQGESDGSIVDSYMNKLSTLIQNLRTDLNEPDLFLVAGELAYWRGGGTGSTAFNTMIRTISSNITNSDWVSAEGLTPLIDVNDPHFDGGSQKTLGERYAEKIIQHLYGTTSDSEIKNNISPKLINTNGGLTIKNQDEECLFKISDISGRTISSLILKQGQSGFLPIRNGIYIISILQNNNYQSFKYFLNN